MTETYTRLKQQVTDRGPWQQTASGHEFFINDPDPDDVTLSDIATALSNQCRYNGHVREFYSVAQHSTMIAAWMLEDGYPLQVALMALHHDSAEAYTGDIIAQMKWMMPEFKTIEESVDAVIYKALGMNPPSEWIKDEIKEYDFIALATEVRDILEPNRSPYSWGALPAPRKERLIPWHPTHARRVFMMTHVNIENAIASRRDT